MTDDRITTTRSTATFRHRFTLPGFDAPHGPGTFDVDIDSEIIEGVNCVAHRHVATFLYLRDDNRTRLVQVDPSELAAAIDRDRAASRTERIDPPAGAPNR